MKQGLMILFVGLFALGGGIGVRYYNLSQMKPVPTAELLAVSLPDLHNQSHALTEWQGKILVLNFWATWCPPCLHEIPEFIRLQTQYKNKNVQFVGIAVDDAQAVAEFTNKTPINYPILLASHNGMEIARQWGNVLDSVPFTVIMNPQGNIVHRQLGEITPRELQAVIHPLLN